MKRLLVLLCVLAAAPAQAATHYLACALNGIVTKCPDNAKLVSGKFLALANIPQLDVSHLPTSGIPSSSSSYTSLIPPFTSATTVEEALDLLISSAPSQVSVTFASPPSTVGTIYRLNSSNEAVLAQGDSLTNANVVRCVYQGNAGYCSSGHGTRLQVLLQPGLSGMNAPAPGSAIFLSTTVAGQGTTVDPIDTGTVNSYSVLLCKAEDVSGYSSLSGGLVTCAWNPQLPVGPLGTGSSPPSDPPYYVDPQIYTCPSGVSSGQLVALTTTNLTLQLADASLQRPAFGRVAQALTATTCRLYAIDLIIAGGTGAAAGTQYYLGNSGAETATPPALGSGVLYQKTSSAVSTSSIRTAIDRNNWDSNQ